MKSDIAFYKKQLEQFPNDPESNKWKSLEEGLEKTLQQEPFTNIDAIDENTVLSKDNK